MYPFSFFCFDLTSMKNVCLNWETFTTVGGGG